MRKNTWTCLLLILAGIVVGGFIGTAFPDTFLNYGQSFGLTIKITIASIIGIAVALVVYRLI